MLADEVVDEIFNNIDAEIGTFYDYELQALQSGDISYNNNVVHSPRFELIHKLIEHDLEKHAKDYRYDYEAWSQDNGVYNVDQLDEMFENNTYTEA